LELRVKLGMKIAFSLAKGYNFKNFLEGFNGEIDFCDVGIGI